MSAILSGTAVAATAVSPAALRVYFQDTQGGIREGTYPTSGSPSGWGVSKTPIFTAKLYTPLAVISWDNGQQVSHPKIAELIADSHLCPLSQQHSPGVGLSRELMGAWIFDQLEFSCSFDHLSLGRVLVTEWRLANPFVRSR
jgi:Fungal fucose-specific lectin